jgi:hypothetical protein
MRNQGHDHIFWLCLTWLYYWMFWGPLYLFSSYDPLFMGFKISLQSPPLMKWEILTKLAHQQSLMGPDGSLYGLDRLSNSNAKATFFLYTLSPMLGAWQEGIYDNLWVTMELVPPVSPSPGDQYRSKHSLCDLYHRNLLLNRWFHGLIWRGADGKRPSSYFSELLWAVYAGGCYIIRWWGRIHFL